MERLTASVAGVVGVVLLTLAAAAWVGTDTTVPQQRGIELVALVRGPLPDLSAVGTFPVGSAGPSSGLSAGSSTSLLANGAVKSEATYSVSAGVATVPPAIVTLLRLVSNGGVRFDVGRSDLNDTATTLLDRLAPLLGARGDLVVEIRGHADSSGPASLNDALSVQRGRAVADYLLRSGVQSDQLVVVGLGASQPLMDNASPEGRSANRRSDINLMEVEGR